LPTSPVELTYARAIPTFGQFNRPSDRVANRPSELSRNTTPLTLCLVVLGRHVERLEFLDVILGTGPP
jgi:hypothetical protein